MATQFHDGHVSLIVQSLHNSFTVAKWNVYKRQASLETAQRAGVPVLTDAIEKVGVSIKPKIPPNEPFSDFRN